MASKGAQPPDMPATADGGWADLCSQGMYCHHHGALPAPTTVKATDAMTPHLNSDDIAMNQVCAGVLSVDAALLTDVWHKFPIRPISSHLTFHGHPYCWRAGLSPALPSLEAPIGKSPVLILW